MKKLIALLLCVVCLAQSAFAASPAESARDLALSAVSGQKFLAGVSGELLAQGEDFPAGTSVCDWTAIAFALLGAEDGAAYLAAENEYISANFPLPASGRAPVATDWQRAALTVRALGGNPTACGTDGSIDLIAGGVYDYACLLYTSADETTFHAADMIFTYDADKLEYTGISDTTNYIVDAATAGKVHVQAYGEAKNLGEAFTLNFKVKTTATGAATVTATSAKIDKAANATMKDAPEAKLLDAETVLTIKATHSVTLPNIFEGETTVEDGADYTFSKTDKDESHYLSLIHI